jgi:DNA-binding GntR family transcriptional regulator
MATKSEEAYKKILRLLLRRHFETENRFSVRELARILNMSVVPISEAIRRLQQQGLLVCQPRKKLRVRTLTPRELLDIMVVREGLECQAVNLLTRSASLQTIEELKAKAEKIDEAIRARRLDALPQLDFDFHVTIARASRCKVLTEKIEELAILTLIGTDPKQIDHSVDLGTHRSVADHIASGSPDQAEQAMRNQLKGITRYTKLLG